MFGLYHHQPFYGSFAHRRYPWGGWGWPHYGFGGIGYPGIGAVQSANNTFVGNYNRSAVSGQRLINTGDMDTVEQTSTPTVVG